MDKKEKFFADWFEDHLYDNNEIVVDVVSDMWEKAQKVGINDYQKYKKYVEKHNTVYYAIKDNPLSVPQKEEPQVYTVDNDKPVKSKNTVTEDINNNICVICGQEFEGYGHNAMPLKSGKCCDKCNMEHVIPERILIAKMTQNKELDTLANKVREALIEGGIKPQKVLIFPNRPMISFLIEGRRDVEHSLADFLITGYLDNNIYDYEISMKHESNQKDNLVAWHQYKIIWGKEI